MQWDYEAISPLTYQCRCSEIIRVLFHFNTNPNKYLPRIAGKLNINLKVCNKQEKQRKCGFKLQDFVRLGVPAILVEVGLGF
jgi:hypothetical protein